MVTGEVLQAQAQTKLAGGRVYRQPILQAVGNLPVEEVKISDVSRVADVKSSRYDKLKEEIRQFDSLISQYDSRLESLSRDLESLNRSNPASYRIQQKQIKQQIRVLKNERQGLEDKRSRIFAGEQGDRYYPKTTPTIPENVVEYKTTVAEPKTYKEIYTRNLQYDPSTKQTIETKYYQVPQGMTRADVLKQLETPTTTVTAGSLPFAQAPPVMSYEREVLPVKMTPLEGGVTRYYGVTPVYKRVFGGFNKAGSDILNLVYLDIKSGVTRKAKDTADFNAFVSGQEKESTLTKDIFSLQPTAIAGAGVYKDLADFGFEQVVKSPFSPVAGGVLLASGSLKGAEYVTKNFIPVVADVSENPVTYGAYYLGGKYFSAGIEYLGSAGKYGQIVSRGISTGVLGLTAVSEVSEFKQSPTEYKANIPKKITGALFMAKGIESSGVRPEYMQPLFLDVFVPRKIRLDYIPYEKGTSELLTLKSGDTPVKIKEATVFGFDFGLQSQPVVTYSKGDGFLGFQFGTPKFLQRINPQQFISNVPAPKTAIEGKVYRQLVDYTPEEQMRIDLRISNVLKTRNVIGKNPEQPVFNVEGIKNTGAFTEEVLSYAQKEKATIFGTATTQRLNAPYRVNPLGDVDVQLKGTVTTSRLKEIELLASNSQKKGVPVKVNPSKPTELINELTGGKVLEVKFSGSPDLTADQTLGGFYGIIESSRSYPFSIAKATSIGEQGLRKAEASLITSPSAYGKPKEVFFHGTSDKSNVPKILAEGLLPIEKTGVRSGWSPYEENFVFLTSDLKYAEMFAGREGSVIQANLPKSFVEANFKRPGYGSDVITPDLVESKYLFELGKAPSPEAQVVFPEFMGETKSFSEGGILGKQKADNPRGLKDVADYFSTQKGIIDLQMESAKTFKAKTKVAELDTSLREELKTYTPEQQKDILAKMSERTGTKFVLTDFADKPASPSLGFGVVPNIVYSSGMPINAKYTYAGTVTQPQSDILKIYGVTEQPTDISPETKTASLNWLPSPNPPRQRPDSVLYPTRSPIIITPSPSISEVSSPKSPEPSSPFIPSPEPQSPDPYIPTPYSPSPYTPPSRTPYTPKSPDPYIPTPYSPSPYTPPPVSPNKKISNYDERKGKKRFKTLFRRRGKFDVMGEFESASLGFEAGRRKAVSTLGASFKVVESDTGNLVLPSSFGLPAGFGLSKREAGVVVQQRGFRLGSFGERQEIQSAKRSKGVFTRGMFK